MLAVIRSAGTLLAGKGSLNVFVYGFLGLFVPLDRFGHARKRVLKHIVHAGDRHDFEA